MLLHDLNNSYRCVALLCTDYKGRRWVRDMEVMFPSFQKFLLQFLSSELSGKFLAKPCVRHYPAFCTWQQCKIFALKYFLNSKEDLQTFPESDRENSSTEHDIVPETAMSATIRVCNIIGGCKGRNLNTKGPRHEKGGSACPTPINFAACSKFPLSRLLAPKRIYSGR